MAANELWVELIENSYSAENNSSNVTVKVKIKTDSYSYNELSPSGYIQWGGLWAGSANTNFSHSFSRGTTTTLFSGTYDVTHASDGTGTVSAKVTFNTGISFGTMTAEKELTLTPIPRAAVLKSAPNFTDTDSPTITYANPLGSEVSAIEACISSDGTNEDVVKYRSLAKDGDSYTFTFTSAEKSALQNLCKTVKSVTVWFFIRTTYQGKYYYSSLAKTFSVAGAENGPTLNPTVKDTNSTTTTLTGNASTRFVKGYSNVQFSVGASAVGGATIVSQGVIHGGQTIELPNGTLSAVESATFEFYATDSRGYTSTKTVTGTLVDYMPPTCVAKTGVPTGEGKLSISVKGVFYNGYFDASNRKGNSLKVQYRLNGESWQNLTVQENGNEYSTSANATITLPDYRKSYSIEFKATDSITSVEAKCPAVKATPVFDWGEDGFTHNTPVEFTDATTFSGAATFNGGLSVNGCSIGTNKELWSGGAFMGGSQTITLKEKISEQANGIVLVFSSYDIANSTPMNSSIQSFFVPKYAVAQMSNAGHYFMMTRGTTIFHKYLTITDTQIKGYADNEGSSVSFIGLTVDNRSMVLRYVIGV